MKLRLFSPVIVIPMFFVISFATSFLKSLTTNRNIDVAVIKGKTSNKPITDTYELPEIMLTLKQVQDNGRKIVVQAKISLAFEKDNQQIVYEINKKRNQILQIIAKIISNKKYDDINTGSGREILKRNIINAVNNIMTDGKIENVFFYSLVISSVSK